MRLDGVQFETLLQTMISIIDKEIRYQDGIDNRYCHKSQLAFNQSLEYIFQVPESTTSLFMCKVFTVLKPFIKVSGLM